MGNAGQVTGEGAESKAVNKAAERRSPLIALPPTIFLAVSLGVPGRTSSRRAESTPSEPDLGHPSVGMRSGLLSSPRSAFAPPFPLDPGDGP